jgi:hypothetical protein
MTNITTKPDPLQPAAEMAVDPFDNWFDPIETEVRARSRRPHLVVLLRLAGDDVEALSPIENSDSTNHCSK